VGGRKEGREKEKDFRQYLLSFWYHSDYVHHIMEFGGMKGYPDNFKE
jgi:hypothetical protein